MAVKNIRASQSNMKMLITMAGKGSRFRKAGINKPKHEISVRGKPMFDWAMKSLEPFFDNKFIFITQEEHQPTQFLNDACSRLGINQFSEIQLSEYTKGQATTALAADEFFDEDDSVAVYNIDTYIHPGEIRKEDIMGDGFIPTFKATGDRWSFVRTDQKGHVIEVSEKEKISDNATAGFYYFDYWGDFVDAYRSRSNSVEDEYGETYIAPLYNYLIDENKTISIHEINPDSIHVLGTPHDLSKFDKGFN